MSLKTSFFNKSIIKSDFKRFWWIGALQSIVMIMIAFMIFEAVPSGAPAYTYGSSYTDCFLMDMAEGPLALQLIVPVLTVILLFGYLNKNSSTTFMHSLPLMRTQLYLSHMLSAVIITLTPIILLAAALFAMRIHPPAAAAIHPMHIFALTAHECSYAFISLGFTAFVCMICGNMLASAVLTYALSLLPLYAGEIVAWLLCEHLYGYQAPNVIPAELLYRSFYMVTPKYLIGLFIAGVVFFILALIIYKNRALEHYGEIIAFSKLRPVFVFTVAICVGFLGYIYFSFLTSTHILLLIPFGLLGIIAAHMTIKRRLTLRGSGKIAIVYCAFIVAIFLVFTFDITGFERRIPKPDTIKSVCVTESMIRDANRPAIEISNTDDIQKVLNMHKYKVDNRNSAGNSLILTYNLNNGKQLMRRYSLNEISDAAVLEPVMMLPELKAQRYPILNSQLKNQISMAVTDLRSKLAVNIDADLNDKVSDAIRADLEQLSYDDYYVNDWQSALNVTVSYTSGNQWENKVPDTYTDAYAITPRFKNTLRVLNEHNLMPAPIPLNEIYGISALRSDGEGERCQTADTEPNITDPETIAKIYSFVTSTFQTRPAFNRQRIYHLAFLYGNGGIMYIDYDERMIPDDILKILQAVK